MTSTISSVKSVPRGGIVRHLPNAISISRLAATPVLFYLALSRNERLFAWLLLVCLVSDIADGLIARGFQLQSPLGAALDSAADFLVTVMAAIGLGTMQWAFVRTHAWPLGLLMLLLAIEYAISFWRYGRLSSFHTYLVRVGAYLQGAFLVGLFFWGYQPAVFYTTWAVACAAEIEELILLALLPVWTPDVRGAYWVWKRRQR
jgi:CDP-diacylglycerol--glycerol-3-phosphate 3-phosphatidyltransferase